MARSDPSHSLIRRESVRHPATGAFDIIGDIHGCYAELALLLARLGYGIAAGGIRAFPPGRRLVFVGDFWDRGPDGAVVLRLVVEARRAGVALAVPGNRDIRLVRLIETRRVRHDPDSRESLDTLSRAELPEIGTFLASLPGHLVLDEGRLVVAHAGLPAQRHGDESSEAWRRAIFGGATGPPDADGLPRRLAWVRRYQGSALVVYGHTPLVRPLRFGRTWGIDTGCVYGGALTALRYPELETVSVPAERIHATRGRPLANPRVDAGDGSATTNAPRDTPDDPAPR